MAIDEQIHIAVSEIEISAETPIESVAAYNKLVNIVLPHDASTLEEKNFCATALRNEMRTAKSANQKLFTNEEILFLAETRLNVRSLVEDQDNEEIAKLLVETDMIVKEIFEEVKAMFKKSAEA